MTTNSFLDLQTQDSQSGDYKLFIDCHINDNFVFQNLFMTGSDSLFVNPHI